MGKSCKVCLSPNRTQYDELRLKGYEVKEIWRISRSEFKENIPLHSFYYHLRHHLERIIQEEERASKYRKQVIDEEIYKTVDAMKLLRGYIVKCSEQLMMLTDLENPKERKEVRQIIGLGNETVSTMLRFFDKLQVEPKHSEEDILKKVILCMKDFPPELILKFTERWENYVE